MHLLPKTAKIRLSGLLILTVIGWYIGGQTAKADIVADSTPIGSPNGVELDIDYMGTLMTRSQPVLPVTLTGSVAQLYCVDLFTTIDAGSYSYITNNAGTVLSLISLPSSSIIYQSPGGAIYSTNNEVGATDGSVNNAAEVAWLAGLQIAPNDPDAILALQAAIWATEYDKSNPNNVTVTLDQSLNTTNDPNVITDYLADLAALQIAIASPSWAANKDSYVSNATWLSPYSNATGYPEQGFIEAGVQTNFSTVPEPSSALIVAIGAFALVAFSALRQRMVGLVNIG